ncbi:HD-GYP domain-containing protein [Desulfurispira natronophila]|uniref:HD-GYP domain-containing protein (C-di-GMP phosphodiesterase class II) n=1 Tax=Desulfurispira natronophila TaxID=682562 RepID=A0A7W7Y4F9_9BACT|nr:HD domain-containing phosphohydrolase [Desulfurispira natronophila]MBB5021921.1 HD-GYP domain-containing protein (c-di-GMP phosphodiesterase class II) [Desulfurispira natronophila]
MHQSGSTNGDSHQRTFTQELAVVREQCENLGSLLQNDYQRVRRGLGIELQLNLVEPHITPLIQSYRSNPRPVLSASCFPNSRLPQQVQHSLRRTLVTIALATHINMDRPEFILEVALASYLADISMAAIPEEIINKPDKLSTDERKVLQNHPSLATKLLRSKDFPSHTLLYILHHHERHNGSGYPAGLKGSKIPFGASLVGICDTYCALTAPRCYRKADNPTQTIVTLLREKGNAHAPKLVDTLVLHLGGFPIGTVVRLSSGEVGVVHRHSPSAPTRPTVAVAQDPGGQLLTPPFLRNLEDEPDVSVARVLDSSKTRLNVLELLSVSG